MTIRSHKDVIQELIALDGKAVLDVGCGDGGVVRMLARMGAHMTGLDPTPGQLEKARATPPAADETYVEAGGQAMPFDDGAFDCVLFFNSLHHVPLELQAKSLEESRRVLKAGGDLLVVEPLAEGERFTFLRVVDDETAVRAHALGVLRGLDWLGFETRTELFYEIDIRHENFQELADMMMRINPARKAKVEAHWQELEQGFNQYGRKEADGVHFIQPMRANLFRKPA